MLCNAITWEQATGSGYHLPMDMQRAGGLQRSATETAQGEGRAAESFAKESGWIAAAWHNLVP